jgi:LmbE family N-acetylglucosaminyl deacetylase
MGTLVCFHAHPDDEVIGTGGVMAKASAEGHRVVLVTATRGEHGEIQPGVLEPGEPLWERRVRELEEAAGLLGVQRHEFLGYVDSGMMGTPTNDDPASFWKADVEEAAGRLATILGEERADAFTVYDDNGGYGHPDHIQVHRVGLRAAEVAGVEHVYEATIDRDRMRSQLEEVAAGTAPVTSPELVEMARAMLAEGGPNMGSPASAITTRVDVTPWLGLKRAALAVHASQVGPESWFLSMPEEAFGLAFGTECFIHRGAPPGTVEDKIL